MKDRYVLLTGGKNNAGDFLIKYRAKQLLGRLRPDRELLDWDGWKPWTREQLEIANGSRAVLLTGGPALQQDMWPRIYPMVEDLKQIRVPILSLGIGWKSPSGDWEDSKNYPLTDPTLKLLEKMNESGYQSGVRDYHTLNVLANHRFRNFVMTGCPALYDFEKLDSPLQIPKSLERIAFSLGVAFAQSPSMCKQMKECLLELRKAFPTAKVAAVFHHSLSESYLKAHKASRDLYDAHREFAAWLDKEGFGYVDISGSAENLIEYYRHVDLHIGYRVHAHIFMSSISRPTVLLNEDGRGKALRDVIQGLGFDAFSETRNSKVHRGLRKAGLRLDRFVATPNLSKDLVMNLEYEMSAGYPRISGVRESIMRHYPQMEAFLNQLP